MLAIVPSYLMLVFSFPYQKAVLADMLLLTGSGELFVNRCICQHVHRLQKIANDLRLNEAVRMQISPSNSEVV